jgi:hypothetical protein
MDQAYYGSQRGLERDLALASNPEDGDHLVAAWVQDEGFGIVAATSFDGGATWAQTVVPGFTVCSGGTSQRVLHARLAFGPGGTVWVAGEVLDGYFPDPRSGVAGVAVAASHDGGLTWSLPVRVETWPLQSGLDHIAADPSAPGSVVVVWHAPEPVATSYVSRSDDGGSTWVARRVPGYAVDALPLHRLVIGRGGTYHLLTAEATARGLPTFSAPRLTSRRSMDQGETWTQATTVAVDVPWQWPTGVIAPDGALHVQWLSVDSENERQLLHARSPDGGSSWSAPVVIAAGVTAVEPSLAVTGNGVLATAFATDQGSQRVRHLARSTDDGRNWMTTELAGPHRPPTADGFYDETVGTVDGRIAAVYTTAGADDREPTDVFVATVQGSGHRR